MRKSNNYYKKVFQGWDLYVNSSFIKRFYSKKKAIHTCQIYNQTLFGYNRAEVVDSESGEVIYSL